MGLRSLLGLPALPEPADWSGFEAWAKAQDRYKQLTLDKKYSTLPESDRVRLETAQAAAIQLSDTRPGDAAKQLNDAVVVAAKSILAIKAPLRAYETDKTTAETILKRAASSGMDDLIAKIHSLAIGRIKTLATTDAAAAAAQMRDLLKVLEKEVSGSKNAQAKGFVDSNAAKSLADAEGALGVPTETPEIKLAHDKLEKRVSLLKRTMDSGKFHDARDNILKIDALCAEIERHKGTVAAAVIIRDAVLAQRRKLDADIVAARKVFAVDPADETLMSSFEATDKSVEGAILRRDYSAAKALLPQLEIRTRHVLGVKGKSDGALAVSGVKSQLVKDIADLVKTTGAIPRVTPELTRLYQNLYEPNGRFWSSMNGSDLIPIRQAMADYRVAAQAFQDAAKVAQTQIRKHEEMRAQIETSVKDRYAALMVDPAILPAFSAVLQTVIYQKNQVDTYLRSLDYDLALAWSKTLLTEIAKAEALAAENLAAQQRRGQMQTKFDANSRALLAVFDFAAYTPDYFLRTEAYRQSYTKVSNQISAGDLLGDAALDTLIAEAAELARLKPENDKARDEGEAKAREMVQVLLAPFMAVKSALQVHLPERRAVLDDVFARNSVMDQTFRAGHYQKVLELGRAFESQIKQIHHDIPNWDNDVEAKKNAAIERKIEVLVIYDGVKAMKAVTPAIAVLLASCTASLEKTTEYQAGENWAGLHSAFDSLAQHCAGLDSARVEHDLLLADQMWVENESPRLRTEAQLAVRQWAFLTEFMEIRDRLAYRINVAELALTKNDPKSARAQWVLLEQVTKELNDRQADNIAARDADAKAVQEGFAALDPTLQVCYQIYPVTPEIKAAVDKFRDASSKVNAAAGAPDWPRAKALLTVYEEAARALAALKSAYDIAVPQVEATRDKAKKQLDRVSPDELKGKSAMEKLDMLDRLRASGKPLSPDERVLQRKLFVAMDYEEGFKKRDAARRSELVDALLTDKDIREARDSWSKKTDDERLAVIAKAIAAECRIYDVPVPPIRLFCKPPVALNGFFDPTTGTINLNAHPQSSWGDYAEALNTAIHENAHNYQSTLGQRRKDGLLEEDGDEFVQSLIFDANQGDGYMPIDELKLLGTYDKALDIYKTQPLERHAYDTGDAIARGIMEPQAVLRGVYMELAATGKLK